jgi:hypothetical protein
MKRSKTIRAGAVVGLCALGGAVAGIAGSAAAPSKHHARAHASQAEDFKQGRAGLSVAGAPFGGPDGGPVHAELVVPSKDASGFETITTDRGSFQSLSGDQLTISEGTKKATYKTLTLTIPADATVYRNDEKAQLSDIKSGDEVMVTKTPSATTVTAADAQHEQKPLDVVKVRGDRSGPMTEIVPGPDGPPPPGAPPGPEA